MAKYINISQTKSIMQMFLRYKFDRSLKPTSKICSRIIAYSHSSTTNLAYIHIQLFSTTSPQTIKADFAISYSIRG